MVLAAGGFWNFGESYPAFAFYQLYFNFSLIINKTFSVRIILRIKIERLFLRKKKHREKKTVLVEDMGGTDSIGWKRSWALLLLVYSLPLSQFFLLSFFFFFASKMFGLQTPTEKEIQRQLRPRENGRDAGPFSYTSVRL